MKLATPYLAGLIAAALAAAMAESARAQAPVIASFGSNGRLLCTNLQPGSVAAVEWAPAATGPWTDTWAGLQAVVADSNGAILVSVPMFYRVRGAASTNTAPLNMALIPAGPFIMGDGLDGGYDDDGRQVAVPLHSVYVSAFYMDKYEVSKALWDDVFNWAMLNGYSFDSFGQGKATNHPAHSMSWYDMVKWCNARSEKEGRTPAYYTNAEQTTVYRVGNLDVKIPWVKWNSGYRLPTEAEWEKAARGGVNGHRFPWSNVDTITHDQANYYSCANCPPYPTYDVSSTPGFHPTFDDGVEPYTSPVGYFAPNGYGLYDMAGNVAERCWDWYVSYSSASQTDPRGPAEGSYRVVRGGSWGELAPCCRVADRTNYGYPVYGMNEIGFRAVLPAGQP